MGLLDKAFSGLGLTDSKEKGGGFTLIPDTPEGKAARKYLESLYQKEETFAPRDIASLTSAEQQAVEMVNKIIKGGIPGVNEAVKVLTERMTGPVEQVPGLEGLFKKTRELGSNLLGRTKRGLALSGNLPTESSRGEKIYGRTMQDIMDEFITSAYPFYSQGLSAKLAAPGRLADLATEQVTTPIALATTIGALPRGIEQDVLNSILEATRKTQEFPYAVQAPIAGTILGEPRYTYQPPFIEPSLLSQLAPIIGAVGAAAVMRGGGTPAGATPQVSTQMLRTGYGSQSWLNEPMY